MRHKKQGFTIVELLVVTAIISVLAAMLMMASDEAVSSARAAEIVNNLNEIKAAVNAWYTSNFYRVDTDGRLIYSDAGIGTNPIQETPDNILHIGKFFSNNNLPFNVNTNEGKYISGKATNLKEGHYGIYDSGQGHRQTWWIGYAFKEGEDKVKDKLNRRADSLQLVLVRAQDPDDLKPGNKNNTKDFYENGKLKNYKDANSVWLFSGIGPKPEKWKW